MSFWPAKLSPKDYSVTQRQFIKVNERIRLLEAVVKKLKERKK